MFPLSEFEFTKSLLLFFVSLFFNLDLTFGPVLRLRISSLRNYIAAALSAQDNTIFLLGICTLVTDHSVGLDDKKLGAVLALSSLDERLILSVVDLPLQLVNTSFAEAGKRRLSNFGGLI